MRIITGTSLTLSWLVAVGACASSPIPSCPSFHGSGSWGLAMKPDKFGYRISGSILFDPAGRVELTATSNDGAREPINSPVDSLMVTADSVRFTFAPIGFSLQGRCVTTDSIVGRFSEPQPPHDNIEGDWQMTRKP